MDVSCRERNSAGEIEEEISDESTCWTVFGGFSIDNLMLGLKIIVGCWRVVLESKGLKSEECEDTNDDDEGQVFDNEK